MQINHLYLTTLICWLIFARPRSRWLWVLGIQLVWVCSFEQLAVLITGLSNSNEWVYNVGMMIEYPLVLILLGYAFPTHPWLKRVVTWMAVGFALAMLGYCIIGDFWTLSTQLLIVGGFAISIAAGVGLLHFAQNTNQKLLNSARFWIVSSLLVYYICLPPIFGSREYFLVTKEPLAAKIYALNLPILCLRYAMTIVGTILVKKQEQSIL